MKDFDPNAAASPESGIFGLPFNEEEAALVLLPVPWEVTTSYGGGTAQGPAAILQASKQVDLFDLDQGNFFEAGIAMLAISAEVQQWNHAGREIVTHLLSDKPMLIDEQEALKQVNDYSEKLNHYVYTETKRLLSLGKYVGVIGGDHSVPFGAIQAFLEKHPYMGILHIDAHADLRLDFEGFHYSHASIMRNVIAQTKLNTLVQVGIRDLCEEEFNYIKQNAARITPFFDMYLSEQKMQGKSWSTLCDEIIQSLPEEVYVSFDIDGLDPRFCPHTGTPVPGGLEFHEVLFLLKKIVQSNRRIIGFDLNEISIGNLALSSANTPDPAAEWDANVGARLLYKLCGWTLAN